MKDEFYFPSKDGNTEIHTVEWKPAGEIKAVLQICHGMIEYVERYSEFAEYLCSHGYYVVGNDHLGHGKSVQNKDEYGYFHKKYGNACILEDMHTLHTRTSRKYPNVPYFIMGHSMGSILTRQYMQRYGNMVDGVILMGVVAEKSNISLDFGRGLCKVIGVVRGDHYRSRLVDRMATGSFNKYFKPNRTRVDWISSDEEQVDKYCADPLCSFVFTVNAYYHMLSGMKNMQKAENVFMIPKDLPILLAAGTEDPCGRFGRGVRSISEKYKKAGIKDVTLHLYAGARHELLNEKEKKRVYLDLLEWMDHRIK